MSLLGALLVAGLSIAGLGDLDDLERKLRDDDDRARREAVQGLAGLDRFEAWELVVGALRDPTPQVADEAQILLGGATDPKIVAALCGKEGLLARDARVRERAAELLGRVEADLDAKALAKALRDKDPTVRRLAAWTVERRATAERVADEDRDDLLKALAKVRGKDKVPGVRAAALTAEDALDPDGSEARWQAASKDDAVEVQNAALLLRVARADRTPPAATASAGAWQILIDAHEEAATRASFGALVDLLESAQNERVRWSIVEALQRGSGLRHRADPRPWRAWAEGLPEDWEPKAPERGGADHEYDASRAALVGLPVLSERVVVLVDFSGSLWMERDGDRTRKQKLDEEVAKTLGAFDASTRFDLVPYTDAPVPWRKKPELVAASEKTVKNAAAFFEDCKASGKGDLWTALEYAFEHEDVDTIIVLSDGAPSGGLHWNLGLIADLFAERNRFRRVVLDAVLVDPSRGIERRWRDMCTASGGRVRKVDL